MDEDWQWFPQGKSIAGPEELKFARAMALASAVARHRDFTLIRCARLEAGVRSAEVLVVEAECHGVPPKNATGIEFRERLALLVQEPKGQLIEVLALRPGFPRLMHQNAGPPDFPPSLCLYFEPPRSVARTWTPESFLGRIQFWLEKSALGELHPADQPVEQLFFVGHHELVLPWDIDDLQKQSPVPAFEIVAGPRRQHGAQTFFLRVRPPSGGAETFDLLELDLAPVVHGRVEPDPATLGGLVDILQTRGADLLGMLKRAISGRVDAAGVPKKRDGTYTVVLLHMPVTRGEGLPVENVVRRGYLVPHGAMKLGDLTGSLFEHDGKFFKEQESGLLKQAAEKTAWRDVLVESIEVIRGLDRASARRQSGVTDEGPSATLIGAGALGGTLLDLWVREGWGQWTAVDKDHVKPHNLVRHPADQRHLGFPKEEVAKARANDVMRGANGVEAVHADACELVDGKPLPCIQSAQLVVDVSTTLDYPRLASTRDDVGRHVSVFVTPKANSR